MKFLKKCIKVGNSLYIPLPKDLVATYGYTNDDYILIDDNGVGAMTMRKAAAAEVDLHHGKDIKKKEDAPQ